MSTARLASFQPELGQPDPLEVSVPVRLARRRARGGAAAEPAAWEAEPALEGGGVHPGGGAGLFDYLRKSRSQGFVVSLSGGADSSAVACLVALMVELARAELGDEAFRGRSGTFPAWPRPRRAPRAGAPPAALRLPGHRQQQPGHPRRPPRRGRGAGRPNVLPGDRPIWSRATSPASSRSLGRKLTWETDDIALQNIQARVRAPSVWLLANVKNALLLATSNRSEAAVGYATMDGDTCGGLSPIAGIDKAFLLHWLRWLETRARRACTRSPPWPPSTRMPPTAELRPPVRMPDRRRRPDALRGARRHRAGGDPRQAAAAWRSSARASRSSRSTPRSSCSSGSSGSSASGAATSGSGSATPRRSTWTTRTSIPRPGAASRSSPAVSSGNWRNCGSTWPGCWAAGST